MIFHVFHVQYSVCVCLYVSILNQVDEVDGGERGKGGKGGWNFNVEIPR